MSLHHSTFEYLKPTDVQIVKMTSVRTATAAYAAHLITMLPEGPDKTYVLRSLRTLAMWANVAITRTADGTPREMILQEIEDGPDAPQGEDTTDPDADHGNVPQYVVDHSNTGC